MLKQLCGLLIGLTLSGAAFAQDYGLSKHAVYGAFGFGPGGFALGADYEYLGKKDYGIGGYVRMYQKDDDHGVPGVTTFGGFIRPHFNKKAWDFYVSPGFGIISIDSTSNNPGDSTTLAASLGLGLLYDLTGTAAIGVENMRHFVWFDKDWRALATLRSDTLLIKFRVLF